MKLPAKQYQVLTLLADGQRDKQIADAMTMSMTAVRQTLHRAILNVGAKTRCEAVALFVKKHQHEGPF